jgi:peptidoglycan/xylan/chitin deacetylase (PgdA/CDA1 family)
MFFLSTNSCAPIPKQKYPYPLLHLDYNHLKIIHEALAKKKVTDKVIALTFDDGPHPVVTEKILTILRRENVKATFFLLGENADEEEELVQAILDDHHDIGTHSFSHPRFDRTNCEGTTEEIIDALEVVEQYHVNARWFRPPYGIITKHVKKIMKERSLDLVLWNIDGQDWKKKGPDFIVNQVCSHHKNGGIILLHDIHEDTAKALPSIIQTLKKKGYRFVTLNQWIEYIYFHVPEALAKISLATQIQGPHKNQEKSLREGF